MPLDPDSPYVFDDDQLIEAFLSQIRSPRSANTYRWNLDRFRQWTTDRDLRLAEVDVADARRYVASVEKLFPHLKESTRALRVRPVTSFYTYLLREGHIDKSPFRTTSFREPQRRPPEVLSRDEIRSLLSTAERVGPHATLTVTLMLINGLNVTEVCNADLRHVQTVNGIRVLTLPDRDPPSHTPLASMTLEAMAKCIGERKTGPLVATKLGSPQTRHNLYKNVTRWARQAGLNDLSPKDLRSTMIGTALRLGADELAVAQAVNLNDTRYMPRFRRISSEAFHPAALIARWLEAGLTENDLLDQAERLLAEEGITPIAPIVVAAATLEARLREIVHSRGLTVAAKEPGIGKYADALKSHGSLKKDEWRQLQRLGDIRNDAAHGHADKLSIEKARDFVRDVREMWKMLGEAEPPVI